MKKIQFNSPVILSFSIICFISLLLNYLTGGYTNEKFFSVYRCSSTDIFAYFRIFGHVFGHQNFNHFFGNMTFVLLVGPILEEKYGSKVIGILMLFTAILTGLINIIFTTNALLGASGIAFMFIILASFVNVQKGKIPLTLILIIIMYVGNELFLEFTVNDQISHVTHIIGGACGAFFGYVLNKKVKI